MSAKLTVIDLLRKYSSIMMGNTFDGATEQGVVHYKVFVYGTLKKGGFLHRKVRDCEFVGNDSLKGYHMLDCSGAFPAIYLTAAEDDNIVYGEVYSVPQDTLNHLDTVEGVPRLYRRTVVQLEEYGAAECYVQDFPSYRAEFERILGGRWNISGKQTTAKVRNASFQGEKPRRVYNRETNQYVEDKGHIHPFVSRQGATTPLYGPQARAVRPPIIESEAEKKDEDTVNAYEKLWGTPTKAARASSDPGFLLSGPAAATTTSGGES